MAPAIGRSLREGFRAAQHGWAGMGVYAGVWVLSLALTGGLIVLTNFPGEILQEPPAVSPTITQPQQEAPANATDVADAVDVQRQQEAQRDRLFSEWLSRAWPVLLFGLALMLVVSVWLNGGQIGYLAALVNEQQSKISAFWVTGKRAFGALLGVAGLWFLGAGGMTVLLGLLIAAPAAAGASPSVWLSILLVLAVIAFMVGMIWVSVRLAFWPLAVVIDRRGPIAGLSAAFRATRGQWGRLFGLMALFGLMGFGVWLAGTLLEVLGGFIGGRVQTGVAVLGSLLSLAANLYLGFATLAALIRFYEDAKSVAPSGTGTAPSA